MPSVGHELGNQIKKGCRFPMRGNRSNSEPNKGTVSRRFLSLGVHICHFIERLDQGHLYPLGEHPGGQTIGLPPPRIVPGLSASQAGTLPK